MRFAGTIQNNVCAHSSFVGSQSPRWSYLVYLYKARGILLVRPLFAFRNCPIATPHEASEIHSRGGPDFKGITPPNILRTRRSGPDQFHTDWPLNRVAHMGYIEKEMDCRTRQIFGAVRLQTF